MVKSMIDSTLVKMLENSNDDCVLLKSTSNFLYVLRNKALNTSILNRIYSNTINIV